MHVFDRVALDPSRDDERIDLPDGLWPVSGLGHD
jgi:hypothetical protein